MADTDPTVDTLLRLANEARAYAIQTGSAVDHAIADLAVRRIGSSVEARDVVERMAGRRGT